MTDQDIIDTIAEWLQANTRYGCTSDRLATDFLAALRSAGYAIVKLPEPDSVTEATDDENGRKEWSYPHGVVVVFDDGEIHWGNWSSLRPQKVRQAAAALLAAAAEADQ